ncbi:MAG TPA: hypothetical protein VLK34_01525 [Nocardioidaceae bacterium]|nr:hypothetical protein [Nocardioidaceae bacterium]
MKDPRSDSDRLRDPIDRSTTPDDGAGVRAESVRSRAASERRRNGFIGSVVIALIALTVIVVPHFISSSPVSNGDTAPISTRQGSGSLDPFAFPCPAAIPVDRQSEPASTLTIDAGAVSIRICPAVAADDGLSRSGTYSDFAAPADALTSGIPAFYASAADMGEPPSGCPLMLPAADPIAIVVKYDDGSTQTFAFRDTFCLGAFVDGDGHSLGGVLDGYRAALAKQRTKLEPPADLPADLGCGDASPHQPFMAMGEDLGLSQAVVCYAASRPTGVAPAPVALDDAEVDMVNADFAARSYRYHGVSNPVCTDVGRTSLVGVNDWGDPVYISDFGCGPIMRTLDGREWTPAPSVADILDQARPRALAG